MPRSRSTVGRAATRVIIALVPFLLLGIAWTATIILAFVGLPLIVATLLLMRVARRASRSPADPGRRRTLMIVALALSVLLTAGLAILVAIAYEDLDTPEDVLAFVGALGWVGLSWSSVRLLRPREQSLSSQDPERPIADESAEDDPA